MRVLALDTATDACSVALYTEAGTLRRFETLSRGHAERLLPMIESILAEGGVSLGMLDGIAASVGPGSFTGVRISVSAAQGLAFGAGLPVVAVTTLEALAWQALRRNADDRVLACLDARMGEVYWGCFAAQASRGVAVCGAMAVGTAAAVGVALAGGASLAGIVSLARGAPPAGTMYGIGRGFGAYPDLASLAGAFLPPGAGEMLPDAADMAHVGMLRLKAGEGIDPADLAPLYLRNKVALTELERAAARTG